MAEIIPSTSQSTKSRIGTFWESSPLINGGQTPTQLLCNALPKIIPNKNDNNNNVGNKKPNMKKSQSAPSISMMQQEEEEEKKEKNVASSSNIFSMTAVTTSDDESSNINITSENKDNKNRRKGRGSRRGNKKKMSLKMRKLSMVEENDEEYEDESDSDADSWFSDLSSDDEDLIHLNSHPEEDEKNEKTNDEDDTKFVGLNAKETFYKSIARTAIKKNKVHLPSTKRFNWSSKKIMKCTGIMNLPPITPRSKFINDCENANYVPEPILIRREQNRSSLIRDAASLSDRFALRHSDGFRASIVMATRNRTQSRSSRCRIGAGDRGEE